MRTSGEYFPLPVRDDTEQPEDGTESRPARRVSRGAYPHYQLNDDTFLTWGLFAVACSTVFSAVLFIITTFNPPGGVRPAQVTTVTPVRPNPYRYLDRVLANTTQKFDPFTNFPPVVFQFDNADSSRRMREDDRGRPTDFGTVYPDDRRIVVTDKVSTVVQFRNLDYGMERCVLTIIIPQKTDTFDPNVKLSDPSLVDVWVLDAPTEFSRYIKGSMDRAPRRRELLTTLTFSQSGPSNSEEFHCVSGEFTTFELACNPTASACSVDFWQDQRAKPVGGLHMIQHSSISP